MLPRSLIKIFAIDCLLGLYENEKSFNEEREECKFAFGNEIEKIGKIESLYTFYDWTGKYLSGVSIITRINEQQKLTDYLKDFLGDQAYGKNMQELEQQIVGLQEKLGPYIAELDKLAFKWNLRASWAADQLFDRDIVQEVQNTFDAAGITIFRESTFKQLPELFQEEGISFPVLNYKVTPYSLFLAGGELQYTNQIKHDLKDYESKLKSLGAKEYPSALNKHAEWWFKHYVRKVLLNDIANEIAFVDKGGGPQPENIRNAIRKFSELIDIKPEDGTKIILPVT